MSTGAIYEIRVQGHVSHHRLPQLEAWRVLHQPNGETLLIGPIADQAALYGLLARLRDLGLCLISLHRQTHSTA